MDMMTDFYPSRRGSSPAIQPRRDPVVWSDDIAVGQDPLTDDQVAAYQRDGYLQFDGWFSAAEVAAMQCGLQRLWQAAGDSTREEVIREPDSRVVRSIFAIHRDDELFARLASDPRLAGSARQLLGSDVYVHQSRINLKKGFSGREFYWHSDFETWHVEDGMPAMRALSVSIALSTNSPHNGPLMVIPGSHRHYVSCVGETPDAHYKQSLRRQQFGVPDQDSLAWLVEQGGIEAPVGPAGSVILFDCNLMHGSNSNITPLPRSNLFMVYNSVANRLAEPFGRTAPRPEFIAHRAYAPAC